MKEEDIDNRIERVIGSVASKKAAMAEWERDYKEIADRRAAAARPNPRKWRRYVISAVAAVALICGIGFSLFVPQHRDTDTIEPIPGPLRSSSSSSPVFRGVEDNIARINTMIDSGRYSEALQAIDKALADTVIDTSYSPERQEYLRDVNRNRRYELTWMKINVLVKTGDTDDALQLLRPYVNEEGKHQRVAEKLLKQLEE